MYESICKFYEYLHKADPTATINLLYDEEEGDAHKFDPITNPNAFPSDMMGLHNHVQIGNSYTMSPANGKDKDGNPKLQRPTYVVLQITTKYVFEHIVGLIQSYLTEMNVYVKEKEIPSLNMKTRRAIIGTTADWCPVSLRITLLKDLEQHVEILQKSARVERRFQGLGVPAFLLRKKNMQMPKMNTLLRKQDVKFIDYYERLCQYMVFEWLMTIGNGSNRSWTTMFRMGTSSE